jgi:sec-independent protein translocase protein TatB
MFVDLSWSHILLLLIVALVVVGPKDLPRMMRTAGQWVARARAMADQFRKSFDEMARQSELDELRTELESLRKERPLADLEHALHTPVLAKPESSILPVAPEATVEDPAPVVADIAEAGPRP